ncbi:MAG: hypothetical protein OEZ15_05690 [Gammaproteobacteria bacterium]|nr:hypothetical protein [Gammaproteobacteria bacterium]
MSNGCSSSCTNGDHHKHRCPVNGKEYTGVSEKTILHHIKEPWNWRGTSRSYYFCDDQECDVVYFGQDNSVIKKSEIRMFVGIKEKSGNSLVCYCFGVTFDEAYDNPEIKAFVIEKAKDHVCECEARNPSGKCCLKNFPSH